ADYLIGVLVIGLAASTFATRRKWVRWLGAAALTSVIIQGILGGLRVKADQYLGTELRIIHGCTAHLFVALMGTMALVTSRGWSRQEAGFAPNKQIRLVAVVLAVAVYLQIVFG